MKKWFKYFVYLSLVFLIFALFKADYLIIPEIINVYFFIGSLLLVCLGFLFDAIAWNKTLVTYGYKEVLVSDSIASMGLSIFGKYIPGKVWIILGRSAYISKKYQIAEKETAVISLNAQFISLWVGLFLGFLSVFVIGNIGYVAQLGLLFWLLLSFLLFSEGVHNLFIKLFKKVFKKEISIPRLKLKYIIKVIPWFLVNWTLWCVGFFLLTKSLISDPLPFYSGLLFALAGTLGILAVLIPGGLGVREGIIVAFLVLMGINEKLAISVSISSRLWFLFGEFFIFLLGLIINWRSVRKNPQD